MLTNKAIAKKEGFSSLYKVFDDRYVEVGDRMDEYLKRIQITDLCQLCFDFVSKNYNPLIKSIKQSGFTIRKIEDKIKLKDLFDKLMNGHFSIISALNYAFTSNLLKKSESYIHLKENNERYLSDLKKDKQYQEFKTYYLGGQNTFARIKDSFTLASEEEFDDYESRLKRETFIGRINSDEIKFAEAINYHKYINEHSKNITMHKTKGSSIDSVIVVMEEFFWTSEYDFSLLYSDEVIQSKKWDNSQKLIYVACSRARKDLTCVKFVTPDEEAGFCKRFPMARKILI